MFDFCAVKRTIALRRRQRRSFTGCFGAMLSLFEIDVFKAIVFNENLYQSLSVQLTNFQMHDYANMIARFFLWKPLNLFSKHTNQ